MRYFDINEVIFKNSLGRAVKIKALLPIPARSNNSVIIALAKNDELDEIATRTDIYGEGYEAKTYDIFFAIKNRKHYSVSEGIVVSAGFVFFNKACIKYITLGVAFIFKVLKKACPTIRCKPEPEHFNCLAI